ncbi:hypothetical protein [Streptomyces cellulosae]|uniref:Uncharacterized protein n=1 Tax=Streptomyces cellulosae TaxID=1968 RepID=A0ABW7Y313_STRCE
MGSGSACHASHQRLGSPCQTMVSASLARVTGPPPTRAVELAVRKIEDADR